MCRLLLILKNNFEEEIIYKFLDQSMNKKFTPNINSSRDTNFNLDGFGLAWYKKKWNLYKNYVRFNRDENLKTIINLIPKNIFIGHLRAICEKSNSMTCFNNTHPFTYQNHIFCHNGCVSNFNKNKITLILTILQKYFSFIKGNTDTEYLFYLFLSFYKTCKLKTELESLKDSIKNFFSYLKLLDGTTSANIIYGNDNYIWVSRYFSDFNEEPGSLYYDIDGDKNIIISSEPVTDNYNIFPKNNVWIIDKKTKFISKINLEEITI